MKDFEARAEAEVTQAVQDQRQARAAADAAREGHANATADAAAARQAALESEQRVREEAIQMQHRYLSEVENQAKEWKEQQCLLNQKAVQQTIQEQLRLKMEQLTEEAHEKETQKWEKQNCQVRPCAKGHHRHRTLSQREREEQAQWVSP